MTISEKFYVIKKACHQRKACEVHIKDEPSPRIVLPIGVCLTIKRGLIIVCKQTDGYFKSRSLPKTCYFAMEDCEEIRILEKKFTADPDLAAGKNLCTDWLVHI